MAVGLADLVRWRSDAGVGSALPCPAGQSGPWSRRTGAPEASATRRDRIPMLTKFAHETIREQVRQDRTRWHVRQAKLLVRPTTGDVRLRSEKGLERLRA
jgi:hypothetical protein